MKYPLLLLFLGWGFMLSGQGDAARLVDDYFGVFSKGQRHAVGEKCAISEDVYGYKVKFVTLSPHSNLANPLGTAAHTDDTPAEVLGSIYLDKLNQAYLNPASGKKYDIVLALYFHAGEKRLLWRAAERLSPALKGRLGSVFSTYNFAGAADYDLLALEMVDVLNMQVLDALEAATGQASAKPDFKSNRYYIMVSGDLFGRMATFEQGVRNSIMAWESLRQYHISPGTSGMSYEQYRSLALNFAKGLGGLFDDFDEDLRLNGVPALNLQDGSLGTVNITINPNVSSPIKGAPIFFSETTRVQLAKRLAATKLKAMLEELVKFEEDLAANYLKPYYTLMGVDLPPIKRVTEPVTVLPGVQANNTRLGRHKYIIRTKYTGGLEVGSGGTDMGENKFGRVGFKPGVSGGVGIESVVFELEYDDEDDITPDGWRLDMICTSLNANLAIEVDISIETPFGEVPGGPLSLSNNEWTTQTVQRQVGATINEGDGKHMSYLPPGYFMRSNSMTLQDASSGSTIGNVDAGYGYFASHMMLGDENIKFLTGGWAAGVSTAGISLNITALNVKAGIGSCSASNLRGYAPQLPATLPSGSVAGMADYEDNTDYITGYIFLAEGQTELDAEAKLELDRIVSRVRAMYDMQLNVKAKVSLKGYATGNWSRTLDNLKLAAAGQMQSVVYSPEEQTIIAGFQNAGAFVPKVEAYLRQSAQSKGMEGKFSYEQNGSAFLPLNAYFKAEGYANYPAKQRLVEVRVRFEQVFQ